LCGGGESGHPWLDVESRAAVPNVRLGRKYIIQL
jgi:hypothetical protein